MNLNSKRFFTRQIQLFCRGNSKFGFENRNRRPRIALGRSWSGARLLVWRTNASLPLERQVPFVFSSLLQRRSWVVLGSSRKRSTKLRKGGASPHAAILPTTLVCPFPQISTGVRFRFFCFWTRNFLLAGYETRP